MLYRVGQNYVYNTICADSSSQHIKKLLLWITAPMILRLFVDELPSDQYNCFPTFASTYMLGYAHGCMVLLCVHAPQRIGQ